MTRPDLILTPGLVTAENLSNTPGISRPSPYSKHGGSLMALGEVMDVLGSTRYQMGRLLGLAFPNNVYSYFSGRRRPSPLILTRAIGLLALHRAGVQFARVRSIDWELGEIHWRNGSVTGGQCWPGEAPPGKKRVVEIPPMGTFKPRLPVSTNGIAHWDC